MSINKKIFVSAVIAAFAFFASEANAAYMHSVTLKHGSVGSQVMSLQQTLNATACKVAVSGVGSAGMETMNFGLLTKAAVMCFQAAYPGLSVDGVVGPMTGDKLAMVTGGGSGPGPLCPNGNPISNNCNPVTGGGSGSGGLSGGAGDITVDGLSTYSSEEVGEDEEDVKVMAFEVEADDESDVEITSVKVEFFQGTAADSEDFTDYAESVSVWMGSDEVGSADVEDFSENSDVYSKSISLDNAVIEAGDTEKFYVSITALNNLDSGDIDTDAWYGGVSSLRFVDGDGVVTTESLTLDVDEEVVDDEVEQTFDFASFATASDVELNASLNDDDDEINEAHVLDVDDSDDSVETILSFTLEAEGDSDITVKEIPVLVTVTGAANVDDMITDIALYHGDVEIATASVGSAVGATETYTFDDFDGGDVEISSGDTEEFSVQVTLKSTADVDLDNGDTIKAELTGTEVDAIDAEDESGEDVGTADLTGTALGEAHAVYDAGIMVTFVSADADRTSVADAAGESDTGEFKITFKVESFDGDMRIDKSCEHGGADAAGQGTEWDETISAADTTGWTLGCIVSSSTTDSEDTANVFEVDEDTTRTFTITVNLTPDEDSYAEVFIESINWGIATNDTNANYYTFNLGDFKTDSIFLNDM